MLATNRYPDPMGMKASLLTTHTQRGLSDMGRAAPPRRQYSDCRFLSRSGQLHSKKLKNSIYGASIAYHYPIVRARGHPSISLARSTTPGRFENQLGQNPWDVGDGLAGSLRLGWASSHFEKTFQVCGLGHTPWRRHAASLRGSNSWCLIGQGRTQREK